MKKQAIFQTRFIKTLSIGLRNDSVGEKAISLFRLKKLGFKIPLSFTCNWDAYTRYIQGDKQILNNLRGELCKIISPHQYYAIRSSSNIEDTLNFSFAGQFESLLNVHGVENVLDAIVRIWDGARSGQVLTYLNEHGLGANQIKMGVIIQEMVQPVLSGVVLTRNPVTYANESIIEAVEGYGDELMQKGANAFRWLVKQNEISGVNNTSENYMDLIKQLSQDSAEIKRYFKMDVDIEWVYDGKEVFYVQCRPISSLSKIKIYSNRISRDILPGMIKPLVWSVNIPLVNSVWIDILESIVGRLNIKATDLAHAFYYRTYFNMGIFGEIFKSLGMPSDALEKLMGLSGHGSTMSAMRPGKEIIRHLPRILRFTLKHLTIGAQINRNISSFEAKLSELDINRFNHKTPDRIFSEIDSLKVIVKKIAYYNIVTPLLMAYHNRILKQHLEKVKVNFLEFDLLKDFPEKNEFNPNYFIEKLNKRFMELSDQTQNKLLINANNSLKMSPESAEFQEELAKFTKSFGHFSDSGNDFSYSPWRENPGMIMRMIANYERTGETGRKVSFEDIRAGFFSRWLITKLNRNAGKYRLLRERVSSNYIFGYGIFRYYFLALGEKLVAENFLDEKEDIFFLSEDQVRNSFNRNTSVKEIKKIVSLHKEMMHRQKDITPPELIYGDNEPLLDFEAKSEYRGVPASAGFYKGPACVINGVREFEKLKQGDVLIIPFSDVGWTPLFPKAGAVVSESGGMLSHCAIVAREYAIPSIVSAYGVMNINDGQIVTVDANAGVLYIN